MKFACIRDHMGKYPVRMMCRLLKVSSSGFYTWLHRPESRQSKRRRLLTLFIRSIHEQSRRNYGSPRVFKDLQERKIPCGRKLVARLMRENGLKAKHRKKFRPTTDSKHSHPVAPNLLDRQFETDAPNKVWVADITYIWTREGWLYLAVILDLYGRRVVGWALRRRMSQELALEALRRAIALRNPGPGLIHHSDRGSQYASRAYQKLLRSRGILCSMSRKGNCWDNAVAESFFRSLKTEGLDLPLTTREEANRCLFDYIEVFYNRKRLHSFLGYVSPADFERMRQVA